LKLHQDTYKKRIVRKLNAHFLAPFTLRYRHGYIGKYLAESGKVTGFLSEGENLALAHATIGLPPNPTVVEIGSFLGRSSITFAGCLRVKGNGKLYCIDPFDGSGDEFSVPYYHRISKRKKLTLREWFERNISNVNLDQWITVIEGTADTVGPNWQEPIDLLFLDGDQSPKGARIAYEYFVPHLKAGGVIALHNSTVREYDPEHDGHRRLVEESVKSPDYTDIYSIESTTFARKLCA